LLDLLALIGLRHVCNYSWSVITFLRWWPTLIGVLVVQEWYHIRMLWWTFFMAYWWKIVGVFMDEQMCQWFIIRML